MANLRQIGDGLRRYGMTLPGAREDHPWGELVLKVKDKVFVFLGKPGPGLSFSVKLPHSGTRLLDRAFAEPTGYGLGKSGWVTLTVEGDELSEAEMRALIEESYRTVAPKTLVKELDGGAGATKASAEATAKRAKARSRPARKA